MLLRPREFLFLTDKISISKAQQLYGRVGVAVPLMIHNDGFEGSDRIGE